MPIEIADKILEYHIRPMEDVQKVHDGDITVSERSCYRPQVYEIKKGRSGKGEHCFIGKGATDWTTTGDLNDFLEQVIQKTEYTRICIYKENHFLHCDYKKDDGNVHIYKNTKITEGGKERWEWVKIEKHPLKQRSKADTHGT